MKMWLVSFTECVVFDRFVRSYCSALAIAEPPRESYADDDSDSITGSMLSLHRPGKSLEFCSGVFLLHSFITACDEIIIYQAVLFIKTGVSNNHAAANNSTSSGSPSAYSSASSSSPSSNYAYSGRP